VVGMGAREIIWVMRLLIVILITASALLAEVKLGKPLELKESMTVGAVVSKPETYLDKTVQVKGKVTEVCQMMGCWMALADSDPKKTLRIKVKDGEIVFPKDAAGKTAIAEGKLVKITMSEDEAIAQAKHEAEEQGRKFNPKSVKGPSVSYQIQGTGAVLVD
jgi:hypothetical protein